MKRTLLPLLACPSCHSDYELIDIRSEEGDEVMEGDLRCSCGTRPIKKGVPRLLPQVVDPVNWETATRFGEEWNQFSKLTDKYQDQFLDWIQPVQPEFFKDKLVLDVGCGKGRHTFFAQAFGAKQVVGMDLSHAVDAAFQNVGRLPNTHIIQADIYQMPLKPVFQYAYSIGVLHHTPKPDVSFQHMVEKVVPGGSVSAWVYGREGNGWIIHILNPIRSITAKLPLPIVKAMAFVLAVIMQAALIVLYRPARTRPWLKKLLPYADYLCSISIFSFEENYSIIFDHLLPEIAFYIPQDEFMSWFDRAQLKDVTITRRNNNSWRGFGTKSSAS